MSQVRFPFPPVGGTVYQDQENADTTAGCFNRGSTRRAGRSLGLKSAAIYRMRGMTVSTERRSSRHTGKERYGEWTNRAVLCGSSRIPRDNLQYPGENREIGYMSDKPWGNPVHSCLATTCHGLVLGVLNRSGYNREAAKDESARHERQKYA
ncbi:hypothetical protein Holit_02020 [Hollandina sp. SP2]